MCLIALALEAHSQYRLVMAANRDEFHHRAADAAGWWHDHDTVLGGRDRTALGTWMGIDRRGRIAALTNVRDPARTAMGGPSRGDLPLNYLRCGGDPAHFARQLLQSDSVDAYAGFNLLLISLEAGLTRASWLSNRHSTDQTLAPGIYGLSNHLLDTPWPKVVRLKQAMQEALRCADPASLERRLFRELADDSPAPDHLLPDTGVPLQRARLLSAPFVRSDDYGTRASTLLLVQTSGQVDFIERSWPAQPTTARDYRERRFRFTLAQDPDIGPATSDRDRRAPAGASP